jgi:hypothetical protein
MSKKQFVVFNKSGAEVDWVDPYVSHREVPSVVYEVSNGHGEYLVVIPEGGRFEIRDMEADR